MRCNFGTMVAIALTAICASAQSSQASIPNVDDFTAPDPPLTVVIDQGGEFDNHPIEVFATDAIGDSASISITTKSSAEWPSI